MAICYECNAQFYGERCSSCGWEAAYGWGMALAVMVTFKPSQVFLNAVPPLVGTMKHSECEHAAALLVLACQLQGDEWAAKRPQDIGHAIGQALDDKIDPWPAIDRNPFFRPDFRALVEEGFARWVEAGDGSPIEFTEAGLEALRKYVKV